MLILFSNLAAALLINEQGKIIAQEPYKDTISTHKSLAAGEWTVEEKKLIKNRTFYLGYKKEKLDGVILTTDINKLEARDKATTDLKELFPKIMLAAKRSIKDSFAQEELIIQASNSVQDLNKSINILSKRMREWHGLYNPELAYSSIDIERYLQIAEKNETSDMGAGFNKEDLSEIQDTINSIRALIADKAKKEKYIELKMKKTCPNIAAVCGSATGARVLSEAGSLRRLAVLPASTVQLLGAEQTMFKFLRRQAKKMPRFGVIHEHPIISNAKEANKAKAARLLADKISIAARVDYFKGEFVGDKLVQEIERRLK